MVVRRGRVKSLQRPLSNQINDRECSGFDMKKANMMHCLPPEEARDAELRLAKLQTVYPGTGIFAAFVVSG